MTNLAALLFDHPLQGDAELLFTERDTSTARQAANAATELAAQLRTLGVGPHRAVALQLPNGCDSVIAMFAAWIAECIFVPVNPRAPAAEVDRVIAATGAAAIVTSAGIERLTGARTYEDGAAFVLFTSGTTGAPKPIVHTHDGYLELLDRVLGPLRARNVPTSRAPAPNLIPVSLTSNAGIYNTLFGLRAGAQIVIMDSWDTAQFARLVSRFAIRSCVLPPAAIAMLCDDPAITDLQPLRYVRSITAPLSVATARRCNERFGVFVLNSYGQAEIGEVIGWTAADAKAFPQKVGAAGRPHPGVAIKLAAVDGRLLVKPPKHAAGYADSDAFGERIDSDGYIDTGDIARIDSDGFVWIEGRAGDVINRGGNKVHPDEVEEVLRGSASIADVAVVGKPDDRLGEVPVAFYTGAPASSDELASLCREHLVAYKVPVEFHHVQQLPRNAAGKLLRAELRARSAEYDSPHG